MSFPRRLVTDSLVQDAAVLVGTLQRLQPPEARQQGADRRVVPRQAALEAVPELGNRGVGGDEAGLRGALPPSRLPAPADRSEEQELLVWHEVDEAAEDVGVGNGWAGRRCVSTRSGLDPEAFAERSKRDGRRTCEWVAGDILVTTPTAQENRPCLATDKEPWNVEMLRSERSLPCRFSWRTPLVGGPLKSLPHQRQGQPSEKSQARGHT